MREPARRDRRLRGHQGGAGHDQRPRGHDQHQQRPRDPVRHHGRRGQRAHEHHRRRREVPRLPGHGGRQREDQPLHDPQRRGGAGRLATTAAGSSTSAASSCSTTCASRAAARRGAGGGIANFRGNAAAPAFAGRQQHRDGTAAGSPTSAGRRCPTRTSSFISDSTVFRQHGRVGGTGGVASRNGGSLASLTRSTIADNVGGARGIGGISRRQQRHAQIGCEHRRAQHRRQRRRQLRRHASRPTPAPTSRTTRTCGFDVDGRDARPRGRAEQRRAARSTCWRSRPPAPRSTALPLANCTRPGHRRSASMARPQGAALRLGRLRARPGAPTVTITCGPTGTITSGDVAFDVQLDRARRELQCRLTGPGQTRRLRRRATSRRAAATAASRRQLHVLGAGGGRRLPEPADRDADVHRRHDAATRRSPAGRAGRPTTHADLHVHRRRRRRDVPVPRRHARRSRPAPRRSPPPTLAAGPAHVRGARARRRGQRRTRRRPRATFTVDTVAPDTTITSGPTGTVAIDQRGRSRSPPPRPASTFQCSLDGAAFATCPRRLHRARAGRAHLPGPRHRRRRQHRRHARDAHLDRRHRRAGHDDHGRADRPDATTRRRRSRFTSTEAGATFQCRVDGAAFATCTSPLHAGARRGRAHLRGPRASTPPATPTPRPRRRRSTSTRPRRTRRSPPARRARRNDTTPTFTFTLDEAGATFQCRVDGAAFAACTSPFTTAALAEGAHTFEVRAIDAAGNIDADAGDADVRVDTHGAGHDDHRRPDRRADDNTPTFTFTLDRGRRDVRVPRRRPPRSPPAPSPATRRADARRRRAHLRGPRDRRGRQHRRDARRRSTFTVDTDRARTRRSPTGADGPTQRHDADLRVHLDEAGSTFQCRVDSAAFAACTSPFTTADARRRARTRSRSARSTRPATPTRRPATRTFAIDTTRAEHDDRQPARPARPTTRRRRSRSAPPRPASTFECRVDSAAFAACTSPFTTATLAAGQRTRSRSARPTRPATSTRRRRRSTFMVDTDRAGHDDRRRPAQPDQRHHADVHVLARRDRRDLRVPRRRRRLRDLHARRSRPPRSPTGTHTFDGPRDRRGRQHRRRRPPRQHVRRRHRARRTRRSTAARRPRPTTRRRRSRSPREDGRDLPVPRRRRRVRRLHVAVHDRRAGRRARTRSRSARATPPATSTVARTRRSFDRRHRPRRTRR